MMTLDLYFNEAIRGNWNMTWQAWRQLVSHFCGYRVIDNDSGYTDGDVMDANKAKRAFDACTIGPTIRRDELSRLDKARKV